MHKLLHEFRNVAHSCRQLQLKRLKVCLCVHACYCISVSAPLLPIHGNVAQSIGECFWGMPPAWLPQVTGDAELADEIVVQVE